MRLTAELSKRIAEFAMERANMTQEEYDKAEGHLAGVCDCLPCQKFNNYLHFKQTIRDWEEAREQTS